VTAPSLALEAAVRAWGRYVVEDLIGAGGGGFVWRAVDPRLQRKVALKFLRVDDARLATRLVREAQAQARVDHPNICKVYEVGTLDGRPFIAMQLVEGATLGEAARTMPLETRVRLVADVAVAIHAAHRAGLIHRDLKPSNILVEEPEPGIYKAVVVDFGLAREMEAPGMTTTGAVIGTPAYMSPEQARGETARLDRRADVYSLGATLYELVTGRPPFAGQTAVEAILHVLSDEPTPPRRIVPSVPVDLETIALVCLEKDPQRRYPSARALADDLERFLDGEPIVARPPGAFYRALKWAGRRRALVSIATLATLAVAAAGGYGIRAQRASERRARVAAELGQSIEQMQSAMAQAWLRPLHDTRADARAVEDQLAALARRVDEGAIPEGLGRCALGRGYMTIYQYEKAYIELDRAWRVGERTPDCALALGEAIGELYLRSLDNARLADPATREKRIADLERGYRDVALERLRGATGAARSPAYVEGLIAYYDEHPGQALVHAEEAARGHPWFYAAQRLQAQALIRIADIKTSRGNYDGARADVERAGAVLDRALEIGRSDPQLWETACVRFIDVVRPEYLRDGPTEQTIAAAHRVCEAARTADPDRAMPFVAEAETLNLWGDSLSRFGKDPTATVARQIELAEKALAIAPREVDALIALGGGWETRADWESGHGGAPLPSYLRAAEYYDRAVKLEPTARTAVSAGTIYGKMATLDIGAGRDPSHNLDGSAAHFRRAIELSPEIALAWEDLGIVECERAREAKLHGEDPRPLFAEAQRNFKEALARNPSSSTACSNSGAAHWQLAEFTVGEGADPGAELAEADKMYRRALEVRTHLVEAEEGLGDIKYLRARFILEHGGDPRDEIAHARSDYEVAVRTNDSYVLLWVMRAQLEILAARAELAAHRSPEAPFRAAARFLDRAQAVDSDESTLYVQRAELYRRRAEWHPQKSDIARGLAAATRATELNPRDAEAHAIAGALHWLSARAGAAGEADRARQELDRALALNRRLDRDYRGILDAAQSAASTSSTDAKRSPGER
jgi:serine/threonine-protein kinase